VDGRSFAFARPALCVSTELILGDDDDQGYQQPSARPGSSSIGFGELPLDPLNRPMADAISGVVSRMPRPFSSDRRIDPRPPQHLAAFLARTKPAWMRRRIIERSNSAKTPVI
jgi:hypothetical protein